jgi:hypothetical protein
VTLIVDFATFPESIKRYGRHKDDCVYIRRSGDQFHLSYVNPDSGVQVICFLHGTEEAIRDDLQGKGLHVAKGIWVTEASIEHLAQYEHETYIAAVAYETRNGPGLWVDASSAPPSEGSVLRAIFDEFVSEGTLDEDSFEQFIHDAKPTVRILDPDDIERFVKQKQA